MSEIEDLKNEIDNLKEMVKKLCPHKDLREMKNAFGKKIWRCKLCNEWVEYK